MAEPQPTTSGRRKRPRRASSPDDDEYEVEKRRGRPRVDKHDESAADRRRTQIRLAQRAYRQRKESTLDDLRKRVSDLTTTIELMNQSFVACRDRLRPSLAPEQMRHLQELAVHFEGLVKDARNPPEDVMPPSSSTTTTPPPATSHGGAAAARKAQEQPPPPVMIEEPEARWDTAAQQQRQQEQTVASWIDRTALRDSSRTSATPPMSGVWGYEMSGAANEPGSDEVLSFDQLIQSRDLVKQQIDISMASLDSPREATEYHGSSHVPNGLALPRTYSPDEGTFARRLFRATCEAAYTLILNPLRNPARFEQVFSLSLLGRDRAKIIAHLGDRLAGQATDDLDYWQAPLIHIGGAGTHYPRRDLNGALLPKKPTHHLGIIGPQRLALLAHAQRDSITTDMTVEIAGFEGEWLDPYDVQGYLEEKGVFMGPRVSYVEMEVGERFPDSTSLSTLSSSPPSVVTPPDAPRYRAADPMNMYDNPMQWSDFTDADMAAAGLSSGMQQLGGAGSGAWMNPMQQGGIVKGFDAGGAAALGQSGVLDVPLPTSNPALLDPLASREFAKKKIVDVTKFVQVLTASAVCLGRAPGYRRKDVDRALALAAFESF